MYRMCLAIYSLSFYQLPFLGEESFEEINGYQRFDIDTGYVNHNGEIKNKEDIPFFVVFL